MSSPFTPELLKLISANRASGNRPLLFANALIISGDSRVGEFDRGDLLLGGGLVVGIGPGLLTAAADDDAIVIDCERYAIVPAVVDIASAAGFRPASHRSDAALAPGRPASFAIVSVAPADVQADVLARYLGSPDRASAVILDGDVAVWNGRATTAASRPADVAATATERPSDRLGTWIDQNDFVHQHLTADGRYDETRGGREHAFQGAFWITGDRIDYRDDLGFWAFGEFVGDSLQHAGYTFHRA